MRAKRSHDLNRLLDKPGDARHTLYIGNIFFGVVMSLIGHRYQAVPAVLETGNPQRHKGLFGMSFDHRQVYCPTLSKHKLISWLKSEDYRAYSALSTLQRLTMKPVLFCRVAASSNKPMEPTR